MKRYSPPKGTLIGQEVLLRRGVARLEKRTYARETGGVATRHVLVDGPDEYATTRRRGEHYIFCINQEELPL